MCWMTGEVVGRWFVENVGFECVDCVSQKQKRLMDSRHRLWWIWKADAIDMRGNGFGSRQDRYMVRIRVIGEIVMVLVAEEQDPDSTMT